MFWILDFGWIYICFRYEKGVIRKLLFRFINKDGGMSVNIFVFCFRINGCLGLVIGKYSNVLIGVGYLDLVYFVVGLRILVFGICLILILFFLRKLGLD